MTLRLPMFLAASFLLAGHAAYASPPPNTDDVRALAASRMPSSPPLLTAAPNIIATNTDEVRALVASLEPASPARSTGSAIVIATNTDEVRALFGKEPALPAGADVQACNGLAEGDRNMSAFVRRENIDEIRPLKERPFPVSRTNAIPVLRGAVIYVRPEAGLTTERLQRVVDCHLAEAAALGYEMPGMNACPLALQGATATVRFDGDRFVVEIRAREAPAAVEVWRRTQRLATR